MKRVSRSVRRDFEAKIEEKSREEKRGDRRKESAEVGREGRKVRSDREV